MVSFTTSMTYHLYTEAADMRKDIDGFCGILRSLGEDPTRRDHVYLFFQRNLKMAKILYRGVGRYEMLKSVWTTGNFFVP